MIILIFCCLIFEKQAETNCLFVFCVSYIVSDQFHLRISIVLLLCRDKDSNVSTLPTAVTLQKTTGSFPNCNLFYLFYTLKSKLIFREILLSILLQIRNIKCILGVHVEGSRSTGRLKDLCLTLSSSMTCFEEPLRRRWTDC